MLVFDTNHFYMTLREKCPHLGKYGIPNAGKYGPEKLRIRTLFTKCDSELFVMSAMIFELLLNLLPLFPEILVPFTSVCVACSSI